MLDVQLKGVQGLVAYAAAHGGGARGGKLQVLPQQLHPRGRRPSRVHVLVGKAGHQVNPGPGPGYGHVQAPLSTLLVQRPETVGKGAVGRLVVADAQDDDIPLVSLHPLNVLDEKGLVPGHGKELVQRPVVFTGQAPPQSLLDVVGVVNPEGYHPQGLVGMPPGVVQDEVHHLLNFDRV